MSKKHPIHDGDVITMWTIQDIPAYEKMQETGILEVPNDNFVTPDYVPAYDWIKTKMLERGLLPSSSSQVYPVWAWYQLCGQRKVDLRSGQGMKGARLVRIEFDVPRDEVLLSDFCLWHAVLNNGYIGDNEQEDEYYWDNESLFSREDIEKSWEKIFNIAEIQKNPYLCEPELQSIQATLWKIDMDQVREVKFFTSR